jgi:hypothetical protein
VYYEIKVNGASVASVSEDGVSVLLLLTMKLKITAFRCSALGNIQTELLKNW